MRSRTVSDAFAQVPAPVERLFEESHRATSRDYNEVVAANFLTGEGPKHGLERLRDGPLGYQVELLEEFIEVASQILR
jgi:hypothetical protein